MGNKGYKEFLVSLKSSVYEHNNIHDSAIVLCLYISPSTLKYALNYFCLNETL